MYLPLCTKYLPGFPITHIGVSIQYAREFLKVPNVSFNMLQKTLVGPWGDQFIADCKTLDRALFLWTVNDEQWMKWSIRKEVDGVITDDPKLFLEICQDYDEKAPLDMVSLREYGSLAWINLLVAVFSPLFRFRYGFYISPEKFRNQIAKTGPGKG
jgi:phosphatidylglycerol phospholipase C